jgi:hypothetical protein
MIPIALSPTATLPRDVPHRRKPSPASSARSCVDLGDGAGQMIVAAHEFRRELRLRRLYMSSGVPCCSICP